MSRIDKTAFINRKIVGQKFVENGMHRWVLLDVSSSMVYQNQVPEQRGLSVTLIRMIFFYSSSWRNKVDSTSRVTYLLFTPNIPDHFTPLPILLNNKFFLRSTQPQFEFQRVKNSHPPDIPYLPIDLRRQMITKAELRFANHLFFLKSLLVASIEGFILNLYQEHFVYLRKLLLIYI